MSAFGELAFSMAMRDTIQRMVREEVDQQRPKYRYGTVTSIDHVAAKCDVIYTGEAHAVRVNMGTIRPVRKGQIVRIEGLGTDKFITDVIGQWGSGHLSGTVAPYHSSGPVMVTWDGDATESGPYKYVARGYRPRGGDRVTMIPTEDGIMVAPSSVDLSLPATVNHRQVPQFYNVRDTVGFVNGYRDYQVAGWASFLYNDDRDPNGWYSDYMTVGFARTAAGIVKLRGLAQKSSAVVTGETLFTLPPGYRPAGVTIFASQGSIQNGGLDIHPDGRVVARNISADHIGLDNIVFPSADVAPDSAWTNIGTTAIPFVNGFTHYVDTIGGIWSKVGYWVDRNGWVHWRGLLHRAAGAPTGVLQVCGQLPLDISVPRSVNARVLSGNAAGNVNFAGSTGQMLYLKPPSQGNFTSFDGLCYPGNTSETLGRMLFPSPYHNWQMWETQNTKGWFAVITIYKTLDGLAQIMGTVKNSVSNGQVITQFPVGFRSKSRTLWGTISNDTGYRIDMHPNGDLYNSGAQPPLNAYVAFDLLTFVPEL